MAGGPAMGSRLHGNDGRTHNRHSHNSGNPRPQIVIPATARIHGPTSSFPRRRESMAGGRRWVPVSTGTTGAGGRTHNRHSRHGGPRRTQIVIPAQAGIHGGGPAMGSRLHGNDGRNPQSSFPPRRESTAQHRHSRAGGNPRRRGGPAAMGSRLHGNDGRTHNRHSRHGGPRRTQIVIPAQAGIHGGGPAMGSRLHGNDGRNPQSSFPPRRESTAGAGDGFPSPRERRPATGALHYRHSRHGGPRRPKSSFPRRRESMAGGRRWVPVSTGTTGAPTIVIPATARIHGPTSSFPPRRERRTASGIGVLSDRMAPLRGCEVRTWATKA